MQLCASGVDTWLADGVVDRERAWTAAKGVGAGPMAEHALALILAAARELPVRLRADTWGPSGGRRLAGTVAGVIGAGGVGTELIRLLGALGVSIARAHAHGSQRARRASVRSTPPASASCCGKATGSWSPLPTPRARGA